MSGHFTFEYIEGDKKGETFDAKIDEFKMAIPEGY